MENVFKVTTDESKEKFAECFGINEERGTELCEMMATAVDGNETFSGAISQISDGVKNANELAWCCVKIGGFIMKTQNAKSSLEKILGL